MSSPEITDQRTMLLTRFVWVHLAIYLRTKAFASAARIDAEYEQAQAFDGMKLNAPSYQRMKAFAEHVAREYIEAFPTAARLEGAVRGMAASLGIGLPNSAEQRMGETIYAAIRAAVISNDVHHDLPDVAASRA